MQKSMAHLLSLHDSKSAEPSVSTFEGTGYGEDRSAEMILSESHENDARSSRSSRASSTATSTTIDDTWRVQNFRVKPFEHRIVLKENQLRTWEVGILKRQKRTTTKRKPGTFQYSR